MWFPTHVNDNAFTENKSTNMQLTLGCLLWDNKCEVYWPHELLKLVANFPFLKPFFKNHFKLTLNLSYTVALRYYRLNSFIWHFRATRVLSLPMFQFCFPEIPNRNTLL